MPFNPNLSDHFSICFVEMLDWERDWEIEKMYVYNCDTKINFKIEIRMNF